MTNQTRNYGGLAEAPVTYLAGNAAGSHAGSVWGLREAKAHLSEVVRRAQTQGPQRVTVRGRDDVFILSGTDYRKLRGGRTGQTLIDALAACPHPEVEFERTDFEADLRDISL